MTSKKVEEFVEQLELLSRKYGVRVEGCGCCGSPIIECHAWEKDEVYRYDFDTYKDVFYGAENLGVHTKNE